MAKDTQQIDADVSDGQTTTVTSVIAVAVRLASQARFSAMERKARANWAMPWVAEAASASSSAARRACCRRLADARAAFDSHGDTDHSRATTRIPLDLRKVSASIDKHARRSPARSRTSARNGPAHHAPSTTTPAAGGRQGERPANPVPSGLANHAASTATSTAVVM